MVNYHFSVKQDQNPLKFALNSLLEAPLEVFVLEGYVPLSLFSPIFTY